jgi:chromosome segregation ATPase
MTKTTSIEETSEQSVPAITEPQNGINERVTKVETGLDRVNDELAKNTRRLDEIQRSVDVVSADRAILESIQGKLAQVNETLKLNSDALQTNKKELRDEFRTTTEILENEIKQAEPKQVNSDFKIVHRLWGKLFLIRFK